MALRLVRTHRQALMIDPNWKCKRCGDCCRYVASEDEWIYATLNAEQRAIIEEQLEHTGQGCSALVEREGRQVCLGQYLFGLNGKPPGCSKFSHKCEMTAKIKGLKINRKANMAIQ